MSIDDNGTVIFDNSFLITTFNIDTISINSKLLPKIKTIIIPDYI